MKILTPNDRRESSRNIIHFDLPSSLACPLPTEARGIARDQVRLLVTQHQGQKASHTTFRHLADYLQPGDVLVVNTSATRASAINITLPKGRKGVLHLSTQLGENRWLVEIREIIGHKTHRWHAGKPELRFPLPDGGSITLKSGFYQNRKLLNLWEAEISLPHPVKSYFKHWARPIKYDKLDQIYPLDWYQTVFSNCPGSAEMPSAGRGFTQELVGKLKEKGILFAPILLHTGVSSLEENERPYPEYMEVSSTSATTINQAKRQERRIIAVGTTAIRAIESAALPDGTLAPFTGFTELFIDQGYPMKIADALLTGFHEPRASHLHMLQSIAGFQHIEKAYQAALAEGYFWHEFGDLHLILP